MTLEESIKNEIEFLEELQALSIKDKRHITAAIHRETRRSLERILSGDKHELKIRGGVPTQCKVK